MTDIKKPFSDKRLIECVGHFLSESQLKRADFEKIKELSDKIVGDLEFNTATSLDTSSTIAVNNANAHNRLHLYHACAGVEFPNSAVNRHVLITNCIPNKLLNVINTVEKKEIFESITQKFGRMKNYYLRTKSKLLKEDPKTIDDNAIIKEAISKNPLTVYEVSCLRQMLNYGEKEGYNEVFLPILINKLHIYVYQNSLEKNEALKQKPDKTSTKKLINTKNK